MQWEIELMKFIQRAASPFLDAVFGVITQFGGEIVCLVVMATIYWAVDKRFGERLGFVALCSVALNNTLKDIVRCERPIGVDGIRTPQSYADELLVDNSPTGYAYSYSFPSGHSQTAGVLYASLGQRANKTWQKALCAAMIFLVGLSRLYLGVHWPKDVLAGWTVGIVSALLLGWLLAKNNVNKWTVYLIAGAAICAFGLCFAATDDTVKSLGSICGFIAGVAFENRFVRFETAGIKWYWKVLRVVIGVALLLAVRMGLKALFPSALIFGFIRYFAMLFVGIGVWPLIFKKLKL